MINSTIFHLISQRSLSNSPFLSGDKKFTLRNCAFSRQFSRVLYTHKKFDIYSCKFSHSLSGAVAMTSKMITSTTSLDIVQTEESEEKLHIINSHFTSLKEDAPSIYIEANCPVVISDSTFTGCGTDLQPIVHLFLSKVNIMSCCFRECSSPQTILIQKGETIILSTNTVAASKGHDYRIESTRVTIAQHNSSFTDTTNQNPNAIINVPDSHLFKFIDSTFDCGNTNYVLSVKLVSSLITRINLIKNEKSNCPTSLFYSQGHEMFAFKCANLNKVEADQSKVEQNSKITFYECVFMISPQLSDNIGTTSCMIKEDATPYMMTMLNSFKCEARFTPEPFIDPATRIFGKLSEKQVLYVLVGLGFVFGVLLSIAFYIKLTPYLNNPSSSKSRKKNFQRA